jgi:uncharacterized protein (DUF58 family)
VSRFRVILLLFLIALIGAVSSGRTLWWSFAGALFALIVIPFVWAWTGVNWLRLSRRTFTRVAQVGQVLEEEFKLTNLSRLPKLWVEVRDRSTLPGHNASRVLGMIRGRQWRGWRAQTPCTQRGRFALGPVLVGSGDPLGIYQMQRQINIVNTLLVYPATYAFHEFPLPMSYLPGGDSLRRRTHYVTTNAAGVRDYVNGDSINRIHWPLSARRQRLIVKEFELDPMSDIWMALDLHGDVQVRRGPEGESSMVESAAGSAAGSAVESLSEHFIPSQSNSQPFHLPPDTEEYVIATAASIAQHFLQQDRTLGLIAYSQHREVLQGERGERQLTKIMETLAVVRAHGVIPFDRVIQTESALLPRGSTLVAISPSPDVAWALSVQQAVRGGLRVVAIVIDAHSFGATQSSEDVMAALAESGALMRVVRCGESIPEAIER